ncbi:MAG: zinc ribbon domain-containing protein [Bacteroidetes bacterium]|nr:zinc ribbon domain-containing protein [Bacteroidota bacterium]
MPTYQYKCSLCGYEFEEFQSMKEEALQQCPECQRIGLRRLIGGGAGMIFKGSGFYLTDYKGGKKDSGTMSDK